jgi:hypothetical protein
MKKIIILSLIYFCLSLQSHANDLVGSLISEGEWQKAFEIAASGNNPDAVYTCCENYTLLLSELKKMPRELVRALLTARNESDKTFIDMLRIYSWALASQLSAEFLLED